jgi:hypothetical protein
MSAQSYQYFLSTDHSRSLKSKLETALDHYRQGLPLLPYISFNDQDYEVKIETNLNIARAREANEQLKQYFLLGQFLDLNPQDRDLNLKNHIIATFLYEYFDTESPAISYLMDVSSYSITRISARDRQFIILSKSPSVSTTPSPPRSPSPASPASSHFPELDPAHSPVSGAGKLWITSRNTEYNPPFTDQDLSTQARELDPPLFLPTAPLFIRRHVTSKRSLEITSPDRTTTLVKRPRI